MPPVTSQGAVFSARCLKRGALTFPISVNFTESSLEMQTGICKDFIKAFKKEKVNLKANSLYV